MKADEEVTPVTKSIGELVREAFDAFVEEVKEHKQHTLSVENECAGRNYYI